MMHLTARLAVCDRAYVEYPDLTQGEFVPPHYVNNIRLFTKKVVKRFRMMYVNGQVLLQSGG